MSHPEPKVYSVYAKNSAEGKTEWAGTHNLTIVQALEVFRELRDQGYRVAIRINGEPGPSYKD